MKVLRKPIVKKYAIEVNEKNITDLTKLLQLYYPENTVQIGAILKDDRAVEFENLEKLLQYENHGNSRIIGLCIACENACKIQFTNTFTRYNVLYNNTVEIEFSMNDQEKYTLFLDGLEKVIDRMKQPLWQTIGMNVCIFLFLVLFFVLFYNFIVAFLEVPFDIIPIAFIISILTVSLSFAVTIIVKPLWQTLLTPVHFLWGEEIRRLKHNNTKIGFIMGFLFGILSSVIASLVYGLLFNR